MSSKTKLVRGKKLINSVKKRRASYMPDDFNGIWYDEDVNNITAILINNIWFWEDKEFESTFTHGCLSALIKEQASAERIVKKDFVLALKRNGINTENLYFSKNLIEKTYKSTWSNHYNCRYFAHFHCLDFWGDYKEMDLSKIGKLVDLLKINKKGLTILFYCKGKPYIEFASKLNLQTHKEENLDEDWGKIPSPILHLISCKKKAIKGFGSYKKKCGMPLSQYKLFRFSSD